MRLACVGAQRGSPRGPAECTTVARSPGSNAGPGSARLARSSRSREAPRRAPRRLRTPTPDTARRRPLQTPWRTMTRRLCRTFSPTVCTTVLSVSASSAAGGKRCSACTRVPRGCSGASHGVRGTDGEDGGGDDPSGGGFMKSPTRYPDGGDARPRLRLDAASRLSVGDGSGGGGGRLGR